MDTFDRLLLPAGFEAVLTLSCEKQHRPTSSIDFGPVVTGCWRFRAFALRGKKKGMNSSYFYDLGAEKVWFCILRRSQHTFLPRRDHSPCSEKPRSLTGAAKRQDAHDAALALSAVRLSGCAKTGRWDPVGPRVTSTF